MSIFTCPVCGQPLDTCGKTMVCPSNHCFDIAKQKYVNLLLSNKSSSKRHGDDKLMVISRKLFLDKGYYNSLLRQILVYIDEYASNPTTILDAGCGECWYAANICEHLKKRGIQYNMAAIDISKEAVILGSKRTDDIELAVASIFNIPMPDRSCDIIINLFAAHSAAEFARLLKKDGILIRAIPLERHLMGLKEAIYEHPYENSVDSPELEGLELISQVQIRERIYIDSNQDIQNLFKMTPYYYKTGVKDQEKICNLPDLDTEIEFCVLVYKKE